LDLAIQGKTALVTAASQGLGLACAQSLVKAGCQVAICARRSRLLEEAQEEIKRETGEKVLAVPADLAVASDIDNLTAVVMEKYGRIDILVGNTGHADYGGLFDLEDSQWYQAFDLFIMSMVRLLRRIVPVMQSLNSGDIVLISSTVPKEPQPSMMISSVLRSGVMALTKGLSQCLSNDNIRLNCVAPGYFNTGRIKDRIKELSSRYDMTGREAALKIAGQIPMNRIGEAMELADLVAFLASRRAEYLTGATIQIDGGQTRGIF
jgi:3-oxoacyl-[acyl-carrier protein] reductase